YPLWSEIVDTQGGYGQRRIYTQCEQETSGEMDQHIHRMIAPYLIPMEVVVQGKAHVRHWTIHHRAVKRCLEEAIYGECSQTDMDIVLDMREVIKHERRVQRVGIHSPHQDHQARPEQRAPERPRGPPWPCNCLPSTGHHNSTPHRTSSLLLGQKVTVEEAF